MRSTRDTFQFGPECIARGFQTLFIMREEGVKLIKTSGIDPLRYYDIFDNFLNSVPTGTELQFSVPLASLERSRPGVIICGDKMRYRIKMLSEK